MSRCLSTCASQLSGDARYRLHGRTSLAGPSVQCVQSQFPVFQFFLALIDEQKSEMTNRFPKEVSDMEVLSSRKFPSSPCRSCSDTVVNPGSYEKSNRPKCAYTYQPEQYEPGQAAYNRVFTFAANRISCALALTHQWYPDPGWTFPRKTQ